MIENNIKRLALFDFDGTLTRKDSLFAFLRFYKGKLYFAAKLFLSLPILLGYRIGIVDASTAKESLLSSFFKGKSLQELSLRCELFSQKKIPLILNEKIMEKFQEHLSNNDKVVIISASIEDWILPWASQYKTEVLGTKLASVDGIITGKFDGENCNGQEKVKRIKAHLILSNYDEIFAYGDSVGDEPMFDLADRVFFRGNSRA